MLMIFILLSKNEVIGLQKCWKKLEHYCADWYLEVNLDKTKILVFIKTDKLHKLTLTLTLTLTLNLSKLLTSCLTAVKNHVIRYCDKVYERSGKICFGLLKILVRYLIN